MAFSTGASAIDTAYRNQFRAGFEQAFQQFDSRLAPYVEMERQSAEFDYYDRISVAEDMTEDLTRYGDNPVSEIPHDRRQIGLKDYELGKYVDPKDLIRVATDPTNEYTAAMRASGNRKLDDIIIAAVDGTAKTGKKGATTMNFVAETANKITVGEYSQGHSNPIADGTIYENTAGAYEGIDVSKSFSYTTPADSGLTLDKLKALRFTMLRLEGIQQGDVIDLFVTSRQIRDLLNIDELINADYSTRRSLEEGNVTSWGGFRFIVCERLGTDSNDARKCLAIRRNSIKMAVAKNLEVDMWRDTSKKNIPYIYFKLSAEAVRMWGEITGIIHCVE